MSILQRLRQAKIEISNQGDGSVCGNPTIKTLSADDLDHLLAICKNMENSDKSFPSERFSLELSVCHEKMSQAVARRLKFDAFTLTAVAVFYAWFVGLVGADTPSATKALLGQFPVSPAWIATLMLIAALPLSIAQDNYIGRLAKYIRDLERVSPVYTLTGTTGEGWETRSYSKRKSSWMGYLIWYSPRCLLIVGTGLIAYWFECLVD